MDDGVEGYGHVLSPELFHGLNVRFGRDRDPVATIREACYFERKASLIREHDGEHIGHRTIDFSRLQGRVALDRAREAHEVDFDAFALKQSLVCRHDERKGIGIREDSDAQGTGCLYRRLRPWLHKRRERNQENRK